MLLIIIPEIINLFWIIQLDLIDSALKKKSNSIAFDLLSMKSQREMSGEPLILIPIKIHLIY